MRNQTRFRVPLVHRALAVTVMVLAFAFPPASGASAYALKTLHSFCSLSQCVDGEFPEAGLLLDSKGNLFGAADSGGAHGEGVVFELTPGKKGKWKYTVLYSFCAQGNCADGASPNSQLIADTDGNLYGTTYGGGSSASEGTIFELVRNGKNWIEVVLYSFCHGGGGCVDGAEPFGVLTYAGQSSGTPYDGSSPLFGATIHGGQGDRGVAFELQYDQSWHEQVIHAFNPASDPYPLVLDSAGNLYGVTINGGVYNGGRVYRLDADRDWHQVVLYDFCAHDPCLDGANPRGRLFLDGDGTLFGTASSGGAANGGVAFSLRSDGTQYKKLYDFCSKAACADGDIPNGDLDMAGNGDFFGTTYDGGNESETGTVFRLRHKKKWGEEALYKFCAKRDCKDGGLTSASVIHDKNGNLFGTTLLGGANGDHGTVFELTP